MINNQTSTLLKRPVKQTSNMAKASVSQSNRTQASSSEPKGSTELTTAKGWIKAQRYLAGNALTISIVCSTSAGFCLIGQAALLAFTVNALVFEQQHWQQLLPALFSILGLIIIRAQLSKLTQLYALSGASKIKLSMRSMLYRKLTKLGPSYIEQQNSAELNEVLHTGVEALEEYYASYLPAVALCSVIPLAVLAVVLPVDWLTGVIFLVTAPLVPMFMILIGLKAEQLNQKHWQRLSRMSNHFLDVLQGLSQLKLFNASRTEATAIASIADEYRRSTLGILKIAFLSSFALEFLATLSIAMVAVTVGFRLYWGELDFTIGFMMLLLAPEFYQPFRNLGQAYHAKMKGVAAAQQMLNIMQAVATQQGEDTLTLNTDGSIKIHYNNVDFHYPDQRQALKNISLHIDQCGLYGIIGPSGAGKSTLIDCLLGFLQPTAGAIHINEQDITHLKLASWQQHIAWVPQNPQLIYASILQNIQIADPTASIEQVKVAATKAGVDQFLTDFAEGWQHIIGERGSTLSGGQKQRIAMARVFLKQAKVLILDEPSAHLDQQTQHWLNDSINTYAQDHCVIVIAHRLRSIAQAKKIFLLDAGKLQAQGTHHQLLKISPLYQALIHAEQESSHDQ